jgi:hypothetical protein
VAAADIIRGFLIILDPGTMQRAEALASALIKGGEEENLLEIKYHSMVILA